MASVWRIIAALTLLATPLVLQLAASAAEVDYPYAQWLAANPSNFTVANREADGLEIRWIVIHDVEGTESACLSWFQNSAARASSHYVVGYDGTVYQMVREKDIAWHAGNWDYNQHSIGIEHAGFADYNYFTDVEYRSSARLVAYLLRKYNITLVRPTGIAPADAGQSYGIIGHDQVPDPDNPSLGGGRSHHYDPGRHWNWTYYISLVEAYYEEGPLPEPPDERGEGLLDPLLSLPLTFLLPVALAFGVLAAIVILSTRTSTKMADPAVDSTSPPAPAPNEPKT